MADLYVSDSVLMRYTAEYGDPKTQMREVLEANAPDGDPDE